jgi:5'-3' exonuclease
MAAAEKTGVPSIDEDMIRHNTLNSLRKANSKFRKEFGRLIICCDGSNPWRKKIFPYYKANRKTGRDKSNIDFAALFAVFKKIRLELQENFSYPVVHIDGVEADDIIAVLSRAANEPTLIYSRDKDFVQLHTNMVLQYDAIKEDYIRHTDVNRFLFDHIVKGDSGDGIPNILSDDDTLIVPGKRQKSVMAKKLDGWYQQICNGEFPEELDKVRFKRNTKLIDLSFIPSEIVQSINDSFRAELNKEKPGSMSIYFMKYRLKKLTDQIADFKENVL